MRAGLLYIRPLSVFVVIFILADLNPENRRVHWVRDVGPAFSARTTMPITVLRVSGTTRKGYAL